MRDKKYIKKIYPLIEKGKHSVKWEIDIPFYFTVKLYPSLSNIIPIVRYRKSNKSIWKSVKLSKLNSEKYFAEISINNVGLYLYKIDVKMENGDIIESSKVYKIYFDRVRARYAAWYEMWPRSQGKIERKSATFKDMENRLADIKKMGFDTIYLAPIYPVGQTNKKGPNNSVNGGMDDPGSLYSIGNEFGGHKTVNPDLGTIKDFNNFQKMANEIGIEIALDIVLTCSPDHPYVKKYPNWFFYNEDGTIKYAENPPKKYQDIYPFNFYPEGKDKMWNEMKSIFLFWIELGVKAFRVDNPHTKPIEFWEWLIKEIHAEYPKVIFLSEAFTEPFMMKLLSKIGFTQSYTYFTWRNTKAEFIDYLTELTDTEMKNYFRGNFFTNTPDILMPILQEGGRPAFKMRITLAATLSSVYGMYNGFELCENKAIPETEEYMNSEKYEYKVWDWNRPGNIKEYITKLNKIRKENSALQYYRNLQFHYSSDANIIFYCKTSYNEKSKLFIAVNLDPFEKHSSYLELPLEEFGIEEGAEYKIKELITNKVLKFHKKKIMIELSPENEMAMIFKLL